MTSVKLIVAYPQPADAEVFEKVYLEEHVPLAVAKLHGMTKIVATKIMHGSTRCAARRYCDTSVLSARPEATIHQPTAPWSAPSANNVHRPARSAEPIHPRHMNHRNGSRNAAPIDRASTR